MAVPEIPIELSQLVSRARKPSPQIAGFAEFLKHYIADWAEPRKVALTG